ncbi:hypothetical protein MTR_0117s0110 [Medicago truncatula]|uniref:Uncharacterized protein n=1 Tax=Medicago truncatula TaxID=3880 RepID=A0A072TH21_MEDTR|nr:hypothetical protein MTR_0117s0110 [Medicago truncatula]
MENNKDPHPVTYQSDPRQHVRSHSLQQLFLITCKLPIRRATFPSRRATNHHNNVPTSLTLVTLTNSTNNDDHNKILQQRQQLTQQQRQLTQRQQQQQQLIQQQQQLNQQQRQLS